MFQVLTRHGVLGICLIFVGLLREIGMILSPRIKCISYGSFMVHQLNLILYFTCVRIKIQIASVSTISKNNIKSAYLLVWFVLGYKKFELPS